jgi:hypothetical protein
MTAAVFDPAAYVDLDRFPVHDLASPRGAAFLARCQAEIADSGACNLQGFIRAARVGEMTAEATALAPLAFRKDTRRNAYFTADDPALASDHPLRAFFPLKMAQLAADLIPSDAVVRRLYEWDPLTDFIRRVNGLQALYHHGDPFLSLNLTYLGAGDLQPWHYDHNEFTVTLLLQASESGGDFEYAPQIRTPDAENFDRVRRLFDGDRSELRRLPRGAGTLTIFKGRHAMHRVSEVAGMRLRISALFSYETKPGQCASDATNIAIYGPRVAAILAARRAAAPGASPNRNRSQS